MKNNIDYYIEKVLDGMVSLEDKEQKFAGSVLSLKEIDYTAFNTWEWPQGVALFGICKLYEQSEDFKYIDILKNWFDINYDPNTPKNINTCAPLIGVLKLYEVTEEEKYLNVVEEWLDWILNDMPKTKEEGFQHSVSERNNDGELWDDTLFMTCLFLMRAGLLFDNKEYIKLVSYQFKLHAKYLFDKETGLWFHGWSFERNDNFANALWARGNSWITIFIPEYIEVMEKYKLDKEAEFAKKCLNIQLDFIANNCIDSGLLHTLLDDEHSYIEMSGTLGVLAGYLKAKRNGYISESIQIDCKPAFEKIRHDLEAGGFIKSVSYGTPMGHDLDFYRNIPITPMPYGQSLALLFLIELNIL